MKKTIITILLLSVILTVAPTTLTFSQDGEQSAGKYGSDSVTCVMNISLYREFFKQWKASNYTNETIKDLYGPWRWVFMNCPKGTQNTYIDGVKIISYMIETAPNSDLKNKYVDTLMMLYDQRIKYFGKEGYVLGRKGVDLATFRPDNYEAIYRDLNKSIDLEGGNTAGPVLVYYMKAAIGMAQTGKADSSVIFEAYDKCLTIIDENKLKNEGNAEELNNWQIVQNNVELLLEPFATCKDLISIFRKKYLENPEDIDLLKKITKLLDEKKCQDDPFYFETTEKLYKLEPSPSSAYLIGKMLMKEEKYSEAINYLKDGEKMEDQVMLERNYKYLAECYRALKNFPVARSYALKAIAINPNDGQPYLMIGDMYAESAKDCGDNDLTSRAAYWVAVDKYIKAKQVDPLVAEDADKRISSYSVYFPSTQTCFFYALKEGDTYKVECWINEETRVRPSK
jgi:tetratricopeptide (TPR) repeat protein